MKESVVKFYHIVYFWLKEPSPANKEIFLGYLKEYLSSVAEIRSHFIGMPAATNRAVIDNTYTYSIVLAFENAEAEAAYQEHPAHLAFVEKARPMWSKVQVYDSVDAG